MIKILLGTVLLLSATALAVFACIAPINGFLQFGLWLAAIDLVMTVFWKPLFKPGPIAKMGYPGLTDKDGIL